MRPTRRSALRADGCRPTPALGDAEMFEPVGSTTTDQSVPTGGPLVADVPVGGLPTPSINNDKEGQGFGGSADIEVNTAVSEALED